MFDFIVFLAEKASEGVVCFSLFQDTFVWYRSVVCAADSTRYQGSEGICVLLEGVRLMCSCVDQFLDGLNVSTISVGSFDANDVGVLLVTDTLKNDFMRRSLRLLLFYVLDWLPLGRTRERRTW